MAVVDGRTLLDNGNASTSWAVYGTGPALAIDTSTKIFGSGSQSVFADNQAGGEGIAFDNGSDRDWTDDVVYMWVNLANPGIMETKAAGGIRVRVANNAGLTNFVERNFEGSDTYSGGWRMFVIDMNDIFANPDNTGGTPPVITAAQYVGVVVDLVTGAMPKMQDNLFLDICWRLQKGVPGIRVEDGTFDWADIVLAGDVNDLTKAWGHVIEESGDIRLLSSIQFGDAAGVTLTTFFDGDGRNVKFKDGANPLPHDLYEVTFVGNSTLGSDIDFGSVVGTGDNRQGVGGTNWATDGASFTMDGETDIAEIDSLNFYGGSITGAGICKFSSSTKTDIIGLALTDCGEFQPNDAEFLNLTVSSPADRGVEMLTTHNMKNIINVAGANVNQVATFGSRTNNDNATPTNPETFTHTVAAGEEDVALLVLIGMEHTSDSILGVSYGDTTVGTFSLRRIGTVSNGTTVTVEAFILYNPPEGSAFTVSVNFSAAPDNVGISAYNLEGVGKFTELSVVSATASAATAINADPLDQPIDNLTIDMVYVDISGAGTTFDATGGTATESRDVAVGGEAAYATSEDTAGVGDRSHDWTWTGSAVAAQLVVSFKSAGLEHAVHLPTASDYSITADNLRFFGYGAAGAPKWHGENSGLDADVTFAASNGANPDENEFENTNGGTLVTTNAVTVRVEGVTPGASVKVIADETVGSITTGDIIFELLADSEGAAEITDFNYEGAFEPSGLDIIVRVRQQGLPNAAIADDNDVLVDETTEANSNIVDDVTLLPVTPVSGEDRYILGHPEQFGQLKVDVSTAGTGGFTITWQYNATGDVWTNLSDVVDGTSDFSILGRNTVSFTIPGDWITRTLNGQGPFFYVRAAYTAGSVTITPLAKKVTLDITRFIATGDQPRTISSTGVTTTVPWVPDTISEF
jgi:hypothetical protein